MEKDSFFIRLSKSPRAFILILIILVSSIVFNNIVNDLIISEFFPNPIVTITVDEIDYMPEKFIPFSSLDSYGIQTVFNSNNGTTLGFKDFLEIMEISSKYETLNIRYNDNYYRLQFDNINNNSGLPVIPIEFQFLSYALNLVFLTSIILIIIIIIVNFLKIINRAIPFG